MSTSETYSTKLENYAQQTLLPVLASETRDFIRAKATHYRFTFQDLRLVSQAARDLEMWGESPLQIWWDREEDGIGVAGRERKKRIISRLQRHVADLAAGEKIYPASGLQPPPRRAVHLEQVQTDREIFGLCPAYSEHTVCCGLHTLDAVRGCPFSCSYCTIQTFYGETAELEADLLAKLQTIELDPGRRYHIGTGQSSDSLVWGNRGGLLDALIEFARTHSNVLLELKTKSAAVEPLLERDIPPNLVCSWSLGTPTTIRNEEPGTANLDQRLDAARLASDRGIDVGFHFHPMIYYSGWKNDYTEVARRMIDQFEPDEIAFISMGAVTLIRPVEREIRKRGGQTKILQMEMVKDAHGKLTYPDAVKAKLFGHLYSQLEDWHDDVFFYLCMENDAIWRQVFGRSYPSNSVFENDFLDRCLRSCVSPPNQS